MDNIRLVTILPATPEQLYDAWLSSHGHSAMTGGVPATTEARVGGRHTAWDGYISGRNIELVKGKKIVQEWKTSEWPHGYPASRLEFTLTAKEGGTELEMVHSKVPAEQVADYSSGWKSSYWEPLKEYLAKRGPRVPPRKRRAGGASSPLMRPPRHRSR